MKLDNEGMKNLVVGIIQRAVEDWIDAYVFITGVYGYINLSYKDAEQFEKSADFKAQIKKLYKRNKINNVLYHDQLSKYANLRKQIKLYSDAEQFFKSEDYELMGKSIDCYYDWCVLEEALTKRAEERMCKK